MTLNAFRSGFITVMLSCKHHELDVMQFCHSQVHFFLLFSCLCFLIYFGRWSLDLAIRVGLKVQKVENPCSTALSSQCVQHM